jgi:hypothetical protein
MLGVSTCASMACHHASGDLGSQGSEYSTWIAVDPHARAYQALFNETSKRIQRNLTGGKDDRAHKNQLCLMCHGLGANVPQALHADGAGCEQCHGPAQEWKNKHYLGEKFNRKTPGFNDLRDDLYARAQTCMKCHVGDGTREVNHDLIAAGHPRLKFEYGAFYANYPRHWTHRETKERKDDPAREARNWLLGQVASAEASLKLLADRAGRAPKDAPWPEFSEYDCAACHHGITSPSERQERFAKRAEAARKQGKKVRPGDLPWGTWYTCQLLALAGRAPKGTGAKLKKVLLELDAELRNRFPAPRTVKEKSAEAVGLLRAWAAFEATAPAGSLNERALEDLMRAVAGNTVPVEEGWDGATQTYLGLAALNHALVDINPKSKKAARTGGLKKLRQELRGAFPDGSKPLYDSPVNYSPKKIVGLLKLFP